MEEIMDTNKKLYNEMDKIQMGKVVKSIEYDSDRKVVGVNTATLDILSSSKNLIAGETLASQQSISSVAQEYLGQSIDVKPVQTIVTNEGLTNEILTENGNHAGLESASTEVPVVPQTSTPIVEVPVAHTNFDIPMVENAGILANSETTNNDVISTISQPDISGDIPKISPEFIDENGTVKESEPNIGAKIDLNSINIVEPIIEKDVKQSIPNNNDYIYQNVLKQEENGVFQELLKIEDYLSKIALSLNALKKMYQVGSLNSNLNKSIPVPESVPNVASPDRIDYINNRVNNDNTVQMPEDQITMTMSR